MSTIWKFKVSGEIDMPEGASILAVNHQHGHLWIWAEVDPEKKAERRTFMVFGTGSTLPVELDRKYLGTVFDPHGFVWHVFEITKPNVVIHAMPWQKP